jgi:hypothetical protein
MFTRLAAPGVGLAAFPSRILRLPLVDAAAFGVCPRMDVPSGSQRLTPDCRGFRAVRTDWDLNLGPAPAGIVLVHHSSLPIQRSGCSVRGPDARPAPTAPGASCGSSLRLGLRQSPTALGRSVRDSALIQIGSLAFAPRGKPRLFQTASPVCCAQGREWRCLHAHRQAASDARHSRGRVRLRVVVARRQLG